MRSLPLAVAALVTAFPAAAQEAGGFVQTERGRLELGAGGAFFGSAKASPATPPFDSAALRPGRTEGAAHRLKPSTSGQPSTSTSAPTSMSSSTASQTPTSTPPDPCRAERSAYLRQLLRATGVDLDDPLALLDGLAGPRGYDAAALFTPYGLVPGVDPIQPLAWDSTLRTLGSDLARCARASR